mgnify:FL=1
MPNYNSTIRKLQLALKQQGFIVSISYTQFYNQAKDCFVTMTSVRHKNKVLFRSGNKIVVIKNLAQILNIIKDINTQLNDTDSTLIDQIEKTIVETKFKKEREV